MDKMREEFEAWHGEQFKYSDKKLTSHGETYLSPFVGGLWSAWKASRAVLCVELPDNCKGMALTVSELHQQLDRAGVSYK